MPHTSTAIFAKTHKGQAEIQARTLRLAPRLRALLIMVDGASDLQQLRRKTGDMPDLPGSLGWLMTEGLIEPKRLSAPEQGPLPSPPPSTAPIAPVSSNTRRKSCALARLYLLDIMERTLGLESAPVRHRLRAATSREEILSAWEDVRPILVEISGMERADRIEESFRSQLPD